MPSALVKYHRHFMPKGGHFAKEMGDIRKNRAHQIKKLRNEVGRKKALGMVVDSARKHVAGVKESVRKARVSKFRSQHGAVETKYPASGGKRNVRKRAVSRLVAHRKLPALPKSLIKK